MLLVYAKNNGSNWFDFEISNAKITLILNQDFEISFWK